ncbi:hypothetical protein SDC9_101239 [bioreactor metagenome]|uniref:Uncharacterized protein n=1 Tax=bioreactor metagenome TaxID=1076179 RepID=A0A645AQ55_9ZZZZ
MCGDVDDPLVHEVIVVRVGDHNGAVGGGAFRHQDGGARFSGGGQEKKKEQRQGEGPDFSEHGNPP